MIQDVLIGKITKEKFINDFLIFFFFFFFSMKQNKEEAEL